MGIPMKILFFILTLLLSTSVFARQYIQCAVVGESTDVAVVNLQTEDGGTLFLSSGMQNPEDERILVNIKFQMIDGTNHIYKVINENGEGSIAIPSSAIGKSLNDLMIDLIFSGLKFQYSCFSRIYNE
jgi:hypothetical protein